MSDLIGTAYDFISIPVERPDPKCRKKSLHHIRELVDRDEVECAYCGGVIDVSGEDWRSVITQLAEEYKKIKISRRG